MNSFLGALEGWDGVGVLIRHDEPTGTWIFIALHSDRLGPATGGCRMKVYARPADGLEDALRLAEGMTWKWAAMDFPFGGGKAVLAVPRPLSGAERRGLLGRFGGILNSLGGRFGTGADLGTTVEDMQTLAETTPYVIGVAGRDEGPMDPSPFTAYGVFEGIRAAVRHRDGSDDLTGMRVLLEGAGAVGGPLADRLHAAGAHLLVTDLDEERAREVADRCGGSALAGSEVRTTPCDIYAPCAVGATLSARSVPTLACRIVAGAANNQLATLDVADTLHERGILYAPDYVINGGGAMAFTLIYGGERDPEALLTRVGGIGARLESIFTEAAEQGVSPVVAAHRLARSVLARGPRADRVASFGDAPA